MNFRKADMGPSVRNERQQWAAPVLEELPKLEKLTLESVQLSNEITGYGSTSGGGSLIFQ